MKLFFRQYGQGFPVIILHGLYGLSDNWVSFGRRLAADFSVFIPDLRNHGQSPHSTVFDFASMEEDIMEFLDDREFREAVLIGHSMGGKVSMRVALDYPERVSKLVVVDIGLRRVTGNREHLNLIEAMQSVDFTRVRSRSDVEKQLVPRIPDQRLRQFLMKNVYWRTPSALDWRLNLAAVGKNILNMFEGVEGDSVFDKPVLLIRGGLSGYVPDEEITEIKKRFPRAQVTTLASASHWVHADAPGEFYERVSTFLSG
jgi:pimeloyl-ACP methyl ester carboxylesterase